MSEKKRNAIKKIALKKYNSTANSMQASKNEAVLADRDVELLSAIVAHGNPDLKRVKRHENIPPLPSIAGQ